MKHWFINYCVVSCRVVSVQSMTVCILNASFRLMFLWKTSHVDIAHHASTKLLNNLILQSSKICWKKFFDEFVRVTKTEIFDEYKKNIYVVNKLDMNCMFQLKLNLVNAKYFDLAKIHHYETSKKVSIWCR